MKKSKKNQALLKVFSIVEKPKVRIRDCIDCGKKQVPTYSLQTYELYSRRCSICNLKQLLRIIWDIDYSEKEIINFLSYIRRNPNKY